MNNLQEIIQSLDRNIDPTTGRSSCGPWDHARAALSRRIECLDGEARQVEKDIVAAERVLADFQESLRINRLIREGLMEFQIDFSKLCQQVGNAVRTVSVNEVKP